MSHDAPHAHRAYAPEKLRCAILTVSDSRDAKSDGSGAVIEAALGAAGHTIALREILRDDRAAIHEWVLRCVARSDIDAVLVTGGTGVSPRDQTIEAVEPLLQRQLPGFGEIFRALSFEEIGPAAMLSRALAGTVERTAVFVMPGSRGAVKLALERLIVPELPHLIGQLRRTDAPPAR
jgi:molybdenum cofactor biosynthesis protein B